MLTEDTLKRLEHKQEELATLFLDQSKADDWRDLSTKERRGDVYWLKKNSVQTLGILVRIQSLLNMHEPGFAPPINPEADSRDQRALAEKAERDATAMIERVRKGQPEKR